MLPRNGCPDTSPYTYSCKNSRQHLFTIVGYAPGYIILNDPYTDYLGRNRLSSKNLVIPESSFNKIWKGFTIAEI